MTVFQKSHAWVDTPDTQMTLAPGCLDKFWILASEMKVEVTGFHKVLIA